MENKKIEKKVEKKSSKILKESETVLILLCITFLIVFIINFMSAFHNVDLVMNMQGLTNSINAAGFTAPDGNGTLFIPFEGMKDTGSDYKTRPLVDYYISAMNNLEKYFILALVNLLLLGFLLGRRLE